MKPVDLERTSIRERHSPEAWMSDEDRVMARTATLTKQQLKAILADTRLPGEIACTYGLTAAAVVRIKQRAKQTAWRSKR